MLFVNYEHYLVCGKKSKGWYVVGVQGFEHDAVHGRIVAAKDGSKIGVGAIEWNDAIRDGWEKRYYITAEGLQSAIRLAHQMFT